jgi:hypothetical protein
MPVNEDLSSKDTSRCLTPAVEGVAHAYRLRCDAASLRSWTCFQVPRPGVGHRDVNVTNDPQVGCSASLLQGGQRACELAQVGDHRIRVG